MNKISQFFTDFRPREVHHSSFFYGITSGIALGTIIPILFPNIFIITSINLFFLLVSRSIFLKLKLKDLEQNSTNQDLPK